MRLWTDFEIELLSELYPKYGTPKTFAAFVAGGLDRTQTAIAAKAKKMGLKSGLPPCFQKGHVPKNKERKLSKRIYDKLKLTMFNKGHTPANALPVGSITIRSYSGKKKGKQPKPEKNKYQWIKTAEPNKWKLLHRHLWEQHNGKIPRGGIVIFKDGDQLNCVIENLEVITRAENVIRNQNREKAKASFANPSDRYVTGRLAMGNPDLREQIKDNPALIELGRHRILLNRAIKNQQS